MFVGHGQLLPNVFEPDLLVQILAATWGCGQLSRLCLAQSAGW